MTEQKILSRTIDVAHLPAEPIVIDASEKERAALAATYGVVAVNALHAEVTATGGARGSVAIDGRVRAEIVQTCVVSLVPVSQTIDEELSLHFVRRSDAPPAPKPGTEVVIDADTPDPPEILSGPTIDVGALVEEAFVLAIDPYPRAPGASLPDEAADATDSEPSSPFAVLAGLAKPRSE